MLQVVHFDIPHFIDRSLVPEIVCKKAIGYRHMCRFHAKLLYEQPIIARLQYLWRLDDDSFITSPVGYGVFKLMRDRRIQYGFRVVRIDSQICVLGLWEAVDVYAKERAITPKFQWPRYQMFYNNFELSDLDVWRSRDYREYIEFIDRMGGIYYHRCGDAPIKSLAVTLLISDSRIHYFSDIAYEHQGQW